MQLYGIALLTALGLPLGDLLGRYTSEEVDTYGTVLWLVRDVAVLTAFILALGVWMIAAAVLLYLVTYMWKWRTVVPAIAVSNPETATAVFVSLLCAGSLEAWTRRELVAGTVAAALLGTASLVL